jgi:hypothetical protein
MVDNEKEMDIELNMYTPIWLVLLRWLAHKNENSAVIMYLWIFISFLLTKFIIPAKSKLTPIGTKTAIRYTFTTIPRIIMTADMISHAIMLTTEEVTFWLRPNTVNSEFFLSYWYLS